MKVSSLQRMIVSGPCLLMILSLIRCSGDSKCSPQSAIISVIWSSSDQSPENWWQCAETESLADMGQSSWTPWVRCWHQEKATCCAAWGRHPSWFWGLGSGPPWCQERPCLVPGLHIVDNDEPVFIWVAHLCGNSPKHSKRSWPCVVTLELRLCQARPQSSIGERREAEWRRPGSQSKAGDLAARPIRGQQGSHGGDGLGMATLVCHYYSHYTPASLKPASATLILTDLPEIIPHQNNEAQSESWSAPRKHLPTKMWRI